jgi:hypothetical protein
MSWLPVSRSDTAAMLRHRKFVRLIVLIDDPKPDETVPDSCWTQGISTPDAERLGGRRKRRT